jgi:hypothetical protein
VVGKKEILKNEGEKTLYTEKNKGMGEGAGAWKREGKCVNSEYFPKGKRRREGFPVARAMCHMGSFPL